MNEVTPGPLVITPAAKTPMMSNKTQMLFALMNKTKSVFEGIENVEAHREKRKKRNKAARRQRKLNARNS